MGHRSFRNTILSGYFFVAFLSLNVTLNAEVLKEGAPKQEVQADLETNEKVKTQIQETLNSWIKMIKDDKVESKDLVLAIAHPEELKAFKDENSEQYELILSTFKEKKSQELLAVLETLKIEDAEIEAEEVKFTKNVNRPVVLVKVKEKWHLKN